MSGLDAIDLPNDQWIRSHKMSEWALCMDPQNRFYGWKCKAVNGQWVSQEALTDADIENALGKVSLREHWPKFEALRASHQTKGEPL